MEEEADLDVLLGVAELLTQHGRHEHKVVVVDPDHIVVLDIFCNSLCEEAIGLCVSLPCGLVEGDLTRVVMEKRPHDGICNLLLALRYYIRSCSWIH